jgi:hypothetical protein
MPKGPRGEKRPGDVIGAAIMVAKIATGEVKDNAKPEPATRLGERHTTTTPRARRPSEAERSARARRKAGVAEPEKK